MSFKDFVEAYPALQEFGLVAKAIVNIMTDPETTVEERRNILNNAVNGLTEKSFKNKYVADQIIVIINMGEKICKEFENTNKQVENILSWLPRMEYHKKILFNKVSKERKSYGLKV